MLGIFKALRLFLIITFVSVFVATLFWDLFDISPQTVKLFIASGAIIFCISGGIFLLEIREFNLNLTREQRRSASAREQQRLADKQQNILQNIFEFHDNNVNNSFKISKPYKMALWDIDCNCYYVAKGFLEEHNIETRMLPHLSSKGTKSDIKLISADSSVWNYRKIFAKPDAVFQDITRNRIYVTEFKSRILNYEPDNFVDFIKPREFLQILIATYVYKQQKEGLTIIPGLRFSNAIVLFSNWELVIPKFDFYQQIYFSLESKQDKDSVKSSELANFISLVDFNFMVEPKDEEEARLRGDGRHAVVLRSGPLDLNV